MKDILKRLVLGEWIESEKIQEIMGMSFSECMKLFDHSRTVEWWSVVGKTEEERQHNGQKITNYFRIKQKNDINEIVYNLRKIMSNRTEFENGYHTALDEVITYGKPV